MSNDRSRHSGGVARAALLSSALFASVLVNHSPVGAAAVDPAPASSDLTVAETTAVSPLSPGVRRQRHFQTSAWLPYGDDFARVFNDGDTTMVIEVIDRAGLTTREEIELSSDVGSFRGVAINDDFVLIRTLTFFPSPVSAARVDRQTGDVLDLGSYTAGTDGAAMSGDGTVVVGNAAGDPYWLSTTATGSETRSFVEDDNGDITYMSVRPVVDRAGTVAAVTAFQILGGVEGYVLIIDTISGDASDQVISLGCGAEACEHEIGGIHVDGFFTNVYVGTFELAAGPGSERVSSSYERISSNAVASKPVSAISPNGRFLVGNSQVGDGPAPTKTKVVVYDTETDRQRTVSIAGLVNGQTIFPLAVSDDGLSVQYRATKPCPGVCLITPSYMGWFQLEPTAPVTNGAAADQIQRLYRAVLGRIPDEGGFQHWMGRYRNGESLLDIATEFAASSEFADRFGVDPTDAALIDALYMNVLGRAGDDEGVAFWLGRRADDMTIPELLAAFAESPENIERTGTRQPITVAEGRVLRLYRAVLGRAPDSGGMVFWLGEYNRGQTLEQIAARVMVSPEFTTRYGDMPSGISLINRLYINVLGRQGDAGGVEFWTGQLEDGMTIPQLLVAFANSEENVVSTGTVR